MNNSRTREFDMIRNQKLSDNISNLSKSSANLQFRPNHPFSNSFTSSFIKKNQPGVCINCTNKHIA